VLEECITEEQRSVLCFSVGKTAQCKDINKEIFPVYGVKCLSRKAVHNWVEIHGKYFADDEEVETDAGK
jgi:hypothetical protein